MFKCYRDDALRGNFKLQAGKKHVCLVNSVTAFRLEAPGQFQPVPGVLFSVRRGTPSTWQLEAVLITMTYINDVTAPNVSHTDSGRTLNQ